MKTKKKNPITIKGLTFEQNKFTDWDDEDIPEEIAPEYPDYKNYIQSNEESLKVYMRLLSRLPLLSKDQEIEHACAIVSARDTLFKQVCTITKFTELLRTMTDCGGTRLRRIFSPLLTTDDSKERVLDLKKQLFSAAANKKNTAEYVRFLHKLSFTFQELEHICLYLEPNCAPHVVSELKKALESIRYHSNKLVEGNLRLVFHRAKNHANKGLSLEDLIQEGSLGLLRAVEKYDVSKGFKFGTYATYWIDQALGRACAEKGRIIRIPTHMMENINRVAKTTKELAMKLGYDPDTAEISAQSNLTRDKIEKAKELTTFPQSIEDPVGDYGSHVSEFVVQTNTATAYDILQEQHLSSIVQKLLKKLNPREEMVLRCRFGIGVPRELLLSEIGDRMNLSKERIRQIECKALTKFKRLCKLNNVRP